MVVVVVIWKNGLRVPSRPSCLEADAWVFLLKSPESHSVRLQRCKEVPPLREAWRRAGSTPWVSLLSKSVMEFPLWDSGLRIQLNMGSIPSLVQWVKGSCLATTAAQVAVVA